MLVGTQQQPNDFETKGCAHTLPATVSAAFERQKLSAGSGALAETSPKRFGRGPGAPGGKGGARWADNTARYDACDRRINKQKKR